jgi:2-methylcitrate dehydratase PrpD
MTVPVSRAWADLVVTSSWDTLPASVQATARLVLTDAVGCALAGSGSDPVTRLVASLTDLGLGGHVGVPGRSETWSPVIAATVIGTAVRAAEPDLRGAEDPVTLYRPAATVGAAALAAGNAVGAPLGELLTAIAVGTEIGCRLADSLEPGHSRRGWDIDSTVGHVASAVTAVRLFRLDRSQMTHAVAIAATEAGGHRGQASTAASLVQIGMAAGDGVEAALFAERGFIGPPLSIEGRRGMIALMGDGVDPDVAASGLQESLGTVWVSDRLASGQGGRVGRSDVLERLVGYPADSPWRTILATIEH